MATKRAFVVAALKPHNDEIGEDYVIEEHDNGTLWAIYETRPPLNLTDTPRDYEQWKTHYAQQKRIIHG